MLKLKSQIFNKGTLFLSGGGSEGVTKIIDTYFLNTILKSRKNKKILYIPIAKTSESNQGKKSLAWVQNKFNAISSENAIEFTLCLNLFNIKDLQNYGAVFIGGGNTYKLLDLTYKSEFDKSLLNYIHSGGIVFGVSAGAVFFGQDISTYIEDKYLEKNIKNNYLTENGLSVLENHSILTHFENGDEIKVEGYFKNHTDNVIAIPTGVALVISKNKYYSVGEKPVLIFNHNGIIKTIPLLTV